MPLGCANLKVALEEALSLKPAEINHHVQKVLAIIFGACGLALGILFIIGCVYNRRRPGGGGVIISVMGFTIIITALILAFYFRQHPYVKNLHIQVRMCDDGDFFNRCKPTCQKSFRTINAVSTIFGKFTFFVVAALFVFAAISMFKIYKNHPSSRLRRASFGDAAHSENADYGYRREPTRLNRTESPLPIAVFAVQIPPRPAAARANNFKLRTVEQDELDESNPKFDPTCAVCLADIRSSPVAELTCGHRFHRTCVSDWLRKAPSPNCPLCNAFVGHDEDDSEAAV